MAKKSGACHPLKVTLEATPKGARIMFRIDEEIVRQRMMELRQEAREAEKARHYNRLKKKKRKSILKILMIFFKK